MAVTIIFDGEDQRGLPIRVLKQGDELRLLDYHAFIQSEELEQSMQCTELEAQWYAGKAPVEIIDSRLAGHLSTRLQMQLRMLVA